MIESIHKMARIINCFSRETPVLGNSEIAEQLGLNSSSVHHLIRSLCEEGILTRDRQSAKYRLGWKLLEWGNLVMNQHDLHTEAMPWVQALVEKLNETVHIGVFDQGKVIFILKVESKHSLRMSTYIGARKPAYCTSIGKVLLAYHPDYIGEVVQRGLQQHGPNTITDETELQSELQDVRKSGYAKDNEEYERGLFSVAAPIYAYSGEVIAALSVAGPTFRMKNQTLGNLVTQLKETAGSISRELGYAGPF